MLAIICLAEAVVLVVVVLAFAGLLRSTFRAHARERDLMLNKVLHSVGRPWVSAPADEAKPEPETPRWSWAPEQLPTDDFLNGVLDTELVGVG